MDARARTRLQEGTTAIIREQLGGVLSDEEIAIATQSLLGGESIQNAVDAIRRHREVANESVVEPKPTRRPKMKLGPNGKLVPADESRLLTPVYDAVQAADSRTYEDEATELSKRLERFEQAVCNRPFVVPYSAELVAGDGTKFYLHLAPVGKEWTLVVDDGRSAKPLARASVSIKVAVVPALPKLLDHLRVAEAARLNEVRSANALLARIIEKEGV